MHMYIMDVWVISIIHILFSHVCYVGRNYSKILFLQHFLRQLQGASGPDEPTIVLMGP